MVSNYYSLIVMILLMIINNNDTVSSAPTLVKVHVFSRIFICIARLLFYLNCGLYLIKNNSSLFFYDSSLFKRTYKMKKYMRIK